MFRSSSRTSANTGVAPAWTITFAVAGHVIEVVITSSPSPTPSASSDRWSAAVPLESAIACFAPQYSAKRSSSSAVFGPVVSQPERIVSATASTSSSPTAGGWNERKVRLRESSGVDIGGDEAYALRRRGRPFERLLARLADRLHRTGPIRSDAELAEPVPGFAVNANTPHARQRRGAVDTVHCLQLALRRRQELRDCPSGGIDGRERRMRNLLAECSRERELVQVDAERELAELRVVAAAEPRGQLDDARAARADHDLRVRRARLDTERRGRLARRLDGRTDVHRLECAWPDVRERDAERRRLRAHAVGHGERVEAPAERERVHRHLLAVDQLLDEARAGARRLKGGVDRRSELVVVGDEREAALPLPVRRLEDARKADPLRGC